MERLRSSEVDTLLVRALQLQPEDRESFLQRSCAGNEALFDEVVSLLRSHDRAGSFLEVSASCAVDVHDAGRDSAPVFQPGELVARRFEIRRFCERGGMGEVYEAYDRELNETVALKTIRPEIAQNPDVVTQFKREIRLSKKVTHPNVCRVYDVFYSHPNRADATTRMLLSMELLRGETLASRLREHGPMSWEEAAPILRQIGEALAAAHRADVVHRDLKPSNIMLVPDGDDVRAVITDFGLAHGARGALVGASARGGAIPEAGTRPVPTTGGSKSSVRSRWGTPDYMSPEQLMGVAVDVRSDVFAVGVIAHEMLTGRPPSRESSGHALEVSDRLPKFTADWIRRCLVLNPEDRTPDSAVLRRGLSSVCRRRVGSRYRSAAVAIILLTAALVTVW